MTARWPTVLARAAVAVSLGLALIAVAQVNAAGAGQPGLEGKLTCEGEFCPRMPVDTRGPATGTNKLPCMPRKFHRCPHSH